MLDVEVVLSIDGLWDFTPRKVVFVVNSGMNGVRFHFMFMFVVWMGGVRWYCLVAKQSSLAGGSLRVEINGQCWIPRSSAYKQLRGRYSRMSAGRGWRPTRLRLAEPRAGLDIIPDARSVPAGAPPRDRARCTSRGGGRRRWSVVVRQYATADATNGGPDEAMRRQEGGAVRGQ
jgi:hypothetical protein